MSTRIKDKTKTIPVWVAKKAIPKEYYQSLLKAIRIKREQLEDSDPAIRIGASEWFASMLTDKNFFAALEEMLRAEPKRRVKKDDGREKVAWKDKK